MNERRLDGIAIINDGTWHRCKIPAESMIEMIDLRKEGGDWRGRVYFRDDCKYGNLSRVDIDHLLVDTEYVEVVYLGGEELGIN